MANNVPVIPNAVMLDAVLAQIQKGLADGLPWLDVAFGRSQKIERMQAGKKYILPNVYCGGWNGHGENDYIEVSPDSHIGNFSFFEILDPQILETDIWTRSVKTPFALIVWFDLRKVYGEKENRNTEFLKAQILNILNGRNGWHLRHGRVSVNRCFERAENIYKGYSLSEIDNQFLIHPYAGFRFEGQLEYDELCFG